MCTLAIRWWTYVPISCMVGYPQYVHNVEICPRKINTHSYLPLANIISNIVDQPQVQLCLPIISNYPHRNVDNICTQFVPWMPECTV